jgi:carboxyl-terminal processing protease
VGVASQFLKEGNVLLAKDAKGRVEPVPVDKDGVALNLPVVVLINQGTASAAEIVAGALRDGNRAQLVGEATFGTGTVLQQFRLSDGSALLLAVEEWLTPKGESFWHKGIEPEQAVTLPPEVTPLLPNGEREMTAAQLHANADRQLLKAINVLEEQIPKAEVRRTK